MGDVLLNGRPAEPWEVVAIARGRRRELERDLRQLAGLLPCGRCGNHGHQAKDCTRLLDGLLAEYPRDPVPRPVTDVPLGRLS